MIGVGGTVAVAIFGLRNSVVSTRLAIESATTSLQQTLASEREGQVTDRYSKAIEQLGSDKVDVRIGGIYALERIACDSRVMAIGLEEYAEAHGGDVTREHPRVRHDHS